MIPLRYPRNNITAAIHIRQRLGKYNGQRNSSIRLARTTNREGTEPPFPKGAGKARCKRVNKRKPDVVSGSRVPVTGVPKTAKYKGRVHRLLFFGSFLFLTDNRNFISGRFFLALFFFNNRAWRCNGGDRLVFAVENYNIFRNGDI